MFAEFETNYLLLDLILSTSETKPSNLSSKYSVISQIYAIIKKKYDASTSSILNIQAHENLRLIPILLVSLYIYNCIQIISWFFFLKEDLGLLTMLAKLY